MPIQSAVSRKAKSATKLSAKSVIKPIARAPGTAAYVQAVQASPGGGLATGLQKVSSIFFCCSGCR
jgi:hypothetical protein